MTTTKIQDERLAVAVNDISTMKDDIKEIKEMLQDQDRRFVTRAELKISQWAIGFIISAITIFFLIKDRLH